jgi:glycolate oxidase iron-sulfur subunit
VRCGLCLPHCPTYRLDQVESESPRGRIALARALATDKAAPSASLQTHLDHCLGCGRCARVCPAKVDYPALLTATRSLQRRHRGASLRQSLLERLMARPALLRFALRIYRQLFPLIPRSLRLLPRPPRRAAAPPGRTSEVALFVGCVADTYESAVRQSLHRLLAASGASLATPSGQGCCGAFHAHAGNAAMAEVLAQGNRKAFANHSTVLSLASGCRESLRQSLPANVRVEDALACLARRRQQLRFRPAAETVALHLPCTQDRAAVQGLRDLLDSVPGLQVIELDAGYGCCGAAGAHMMDLPERAASLRQPLLDQLAASGASCVLSANIGCRLHLHVASVPVLHPLEFLAGRLDLDRDATPSAISLAP